MSSRGSARTGRGGSPSARRSLTVVLALELEQDEGGIDGELADPTLVARRRAALLSRAPLLGEYFGVDVDATSGSVGSPGVGGGARPARPTRFALALARGLDRGRRCFRTVADSSRRSTQFVRFVTGGGSDASAAETGTEAETEDPERVRAIKQFVFPAMRRCLHPNKVAVRVATRVAEIWNSSTACWGVGECVCCFHFSRTTDWIIIFAETPSVVGFRYRRFLLV